MDDIEAETSLCGQPRLGSNRALRMHLSHPATVEHVTHLIGREMAQRDGPTWPNSPILKADTTLLVYG